MENKDLESLNEPLPTEETTRTVNQETSTSTKSAIDSDTLDPTEHQAWASDSSNAICESSTDTTPHAGASAAIENANADSMDTKLESDPTANQSLDAQMPTSETDRSPNASSYCPKCGSPLKDNQVFCGSCGAKVDNLKGKQNSKPKISPKALGIVGGVAGVAIVLFVLLTFIIPAMTVTPLDLIKENKWEQAYSKASDEEKDNILIANLSAYMSTEKVINNLKDPSSFNLREAYFSKSSHELVLEVGGKNSYGGMVSSYYYFTWDDKMGEFSLYVSLSSLDEEKTSKYDSFDESIEKKLKNIARKNVMTVINDDENKLNNDYIAAINDLFKEDKLKDVALLGDVNLKLVGSNNA